MWWCCGKKNQDAPGCRFAKHVNKDAENEDEEAEEENISKIKCICCKKNGHT